MQNYLKSLSPKGKGVDVNEISFAKQFLTTVDQKASKLSPDHVEDARKLPAQPAVCAMLFSFFKYIDDHSRFSLLS